MILAGEIGATRTRLAAYETEGTQLKCAVDKTFVTAEHEGLGPILSSFIKGEGLPVYSACFGVAGPVRGGRCKISNLTWPTIDARELAQQLRLNSVGLLNDMEAYAYGIDALESKDFITLSEGIEDAEGNRVVISARTGLGVAGLYWDGARHHPFACEGGHTDFAPRTDLEAQLLFYMQRRFGHISYERIVSGPGIKCIYDFLRDSKEAEEPDWLRAQMEAAPDPPALISKLAAEGKAPICDRVMTIFVSIFGAETGNCALKFNSAGGIFIGGSIAAKNVPRMQAPEFMKSFLDKGRMETLLKDMPIKIVLNDDCGLIGAARYTLIQRAFRPPTRAAS